MKKIIKLLLIGIFIIISSIIFLFIQTNTDKKINLDIKQKNENQFVYKVSGAVFANENIKSTKKLTYRELFHKIGVGSDAKIEIFTLDDYAPTNSEIYIPYRKVKIKWSSLKDVQQLTIFDIQNKYAKLIIDFKNKNIKRNLTWSDLAQIKGIGIKTIEKLKEFLILDL
ncbi:hypothetical protein V2E24_00475 [Mycoplasmopsis ciconiae]|uniref:Competence protein ComEA n=1 Tax=Mycoplasmopsis ciconiae TaxID=561067 RepID=A0ABU7MKI9_9BACT|nr:hypothetical protein [Mycoplasmopsis ciconiae]